MAVTQGPALASMAQQFSGLPMGDLIGAPLMAAADANHKMAMTQVKFMLDTCFSCKERKLAKGETTEGEKVNMYISPAPTQTNVILAIMMLQI